MRDTTHQHHYSTCFWFNFYLSVCVPKTCLFVGLVECWSKAVGKFHYQRAYCIVHIINIMLSLCVFNFVSLCMCVCNCCITHTGWCSVSKHLICEYTISVFYFPSLSISISLSLSYHILSIYLYIFPHLSTLSLFLSSTICPHRSLVHRMADRRI